MHILAHLASIVIQWICDHLGERIMVSHIKQLPVEGVIELEQDRRFISIIERSNVDVKVNEINTSVPPDVIDSPWHKEHRVCFWDDFRFLPTHT